MRQTELHLTTEDRATTDAIRSKGRHPAREVNRAHILSCLDQGIAEAWIMGVLKIGRTAIWRTRAAYLQGGLELALYDVPRPGRPVQYGTQAQARLSALAGSTPPMGKQRWTTNDLAQAARREPSLDGVSLETVRRILKKTNSNPGPGGTAPPQG